jgi:hypothetical protein
MILMSAGRTSARAALIAVGVLVSALLMAAPSWAEAPTTICVPEAASTSVLSTNTKGECPSTKAGKTTVKYKAAALPGPAELEKLDKILPHVSYVESGVGGKPTIQFSGVNVQVVNGEGQTLSANGEGNLVIGYDERRAEGCSQLPCPFTPQTGSHNLVLGEGQTFTGDGGIVAGRANKISGPFDFVSGEFNVAEGVSASVTGGRGNAATGEGASVTGGEQNEATDRFDSVTGGRANKATGYDDSVTGGEENTASATAVHPISGEFTGGASVSGGLQNAASQVDASISGGEGNTASGAAAFVGGGKENKAKGNYTSILGGKLQEATVEFETLA